ncbi:unnamed protein product [Mycena citricolor]|uniref:Uncharacterized protein n=1 Tax=Mycena citricolor TaxID=2018698 RepID=A0AAD2H0N0_9AGAR|nr:unnamed protein product [Mycena citricolor]
MMGSPFQEAQIERPLHHLREGTPGAALPVRVTPSRARAGSGVAHAKVLQDESPVTVRRPLWLEGQHNRWDGVRIGEAAQENRTGLLDLPRVLQSPLNKPAVLYPPCFPLERHRFHLRCHLLHHIMQCAVRGGAEKVSQAGGECRMATDIPCALGVLAGRETDHIRAHRLFPRTSDFRTRSSATIPETGPRMKPERGRQGHRDERSCRRNT